MTVLIQVSALAELAEALRGLDGPPHERWSAVDARFQTWVGGSDLRDKLRAYLSDLPPEELAAVRGRSRETTTHFAWCLRDQPAEGFTCWLHEYKPQRDWRPGYADSVHNHRYHFSTTIVTGGYLHERYVATVEPTTHMISSVELVDRVTCRVGDAGMMLANEFHRIPEALDKTMTFLVKSREVVRWSLSYDPTTRTSHQHIPVESRLDDLASRI
jgi:hypothetical protein